MNLRKLAKGKPCLVRLPGCSHSTETTVLAHIRRAGVGGMGMKPPDIIGVWACSNCHDVLDGRVPFVDDLGELDTYILEAMCRTLDEIWRLGVRLELR